MTAAPAATFTVRRILVALDASPQSLAALAAAVDLAARLHAEVRGLFVEDVDLLRLAGHSAARLVGACTAATRPTDSAEMERTLHSLAARARRALAESAGLGGVPWSFGVARGRVAAEILAAAADADLVCVGRASWSGGRGARVGATARRLAADAPHCVLLVRAADRPASRPAVLFDGTAAARRALAVAAAVAQRDGGRVLVLLPCSDVARGALLRGEAAEHLRGSDVSAEFRVLSDETPDAVAAADAADALLVVGCDRGAPVEATARLLARLDRTVLIVR